MAPRRPAYRSQPLPFLPGWGPRPGSGGGGRCAMQLLRVGVLPGPVSLVPHPLRRLQPQLRRPPARAAQEAAGASDHQWAAAPQAAGLDAGGPRGGRRAAWTGAGRGPSSGLALVPPCPLHRSSTPSWRWRSSGSPWTAARSRPAWWMTMVRARVQAPTSQPVPRAASQLPCWQCQSAWEQKGARATSCDLNNHPGCALGWKPGDCPLGPRGCSPQPSGGGCGPR